MFLVPSLGLLKVPVCLCPSQDGVDRIVPIQVHSGLTAQNESHPFDSAGSVKAILLLVRAKITLDFIVPVSSGRLK